MEMLAQHEQLDCRDLSPIKASFIPTGSIFFGERYLKSNRPCCAGMPHFHFTSVWLCDYFSREI
jgi:hypothetical protein